MRRTPLTLALAAVVLTAAPLAACSSTEDAAPRTTTTTRPTTTVTVPTTAGPTANGFPADWVAPELRWTDCEVGDRTECTRMEVPLDWSAPAGPKVELALARQRATGERVGTLLSNPGGPGGSGLELLSYGSFTRKVYQQFDVVSWDPRGVGGSTPATCGDGIAPFLTNDPDPDNPDEQAAIERAAKAVADSCAADALTLFEHIGTPDVARDLEAIRRALGNEPLNYLGFSYGTQIGQQYAEFFPGNIRTMVLDGVVDPSLGYTEFLLGQTKAFDDAFNRAAADCARAGAKECGVPDLGAAYDRVRARVELETLPAGDQRVGPSELATAATYVAYLSDGWRDLGPALAAALKGDGTALLDLANSYYDNEGYPTYAGVTCTDTPPPKGAEEYRKFADRAELVSPRFGGAVANELLPCAFWPVAPTGTPGPAQVVGAPPVLVVGNTGDPATPYSNAVAVSRQLPGAVLLTVEAGGHTAYGSNACATRTVDAYLVATTLPAPGAVCR
jgi:pimeloyl-ACP methyl ester carboxylesterase